MIEVVNYRTNIKGARLGHLSLRITPWKIEIRDITVFQKNGNRWLSMPSREYEKDGEKKYMPYVSFFEKIDNDNFQKSALNAMDKWIKEQDAKNTIQGKPEVALDFSFGSGPPSQNSDSVPF